MARPPSKGAYAPLAAQYYLDDAILEAGPLAELMWVRILSFLASVPTDGYISERQIKTVGVGLRDWRNRVSVLLEVGLLTAVSGGYLARNWKKWNRTTAEQNKMLAQDRERKARAKSSSGTDGMQIDSGSRQIGDSWDAEDASEDARQVLKQPRKRAEKPHNSERNDTPFRADSVSRTEQNRTEQVKDIVHTTRARQLASDFDEWWSIYPRKQGKDAARRKYLTVRKTVDAEPILVGTRSYALLMAGEDKQFVKLPAGWLGDGRWSDDHSAAVSKPTVSGTHTPAACSTHGYPLPCPYASEGGCF